MQLSKITVSQRGRIAKKCNQIPMHFLSTTQIRSTLCYTSTLQPAGFQHLLFTTLLQIQSVLVVRRAAFLWLSESLNGALSVCVGGPTETPLLLRCVSFAVCSVCVEGPVLPPIFPSPFCALHLSPMLPFFCTPAAWLCSHGRSRTEGVTGFKWRSGEVRQMFIAPGGEWRATRQGVKTF